MASSQGGKNKKYGRNTKDCTRYSLEKRLEKNKARSLKRHLRRMGLDPKYLGGYTSPGVKAHPKG